MKYVRFQESVLGLLSILFTIICYTFDVKYVRFQESVLGLLSPDFVHNYMNRIETNYLVCRLYHYLCMIVHSSNFYASPPLFEVLRINTVGLTTILILCFAVQRGQQLDDHIIIGTPGTLLDWAVKFKVFDLRKINVFVLDEADVMIDTQGHQDQSIRIQR